MEAPCEWKFCGQGGPSAGTGKRGALPESCPCGIIFGFHKLPSMVAGIYQVINKLFDKSVNGWMSEQ